VGSAVLSRLPRIPVTVTYALAVVIITKVLDALGDDVRDRIVRHASTNLHNLANGHVGTLLASAFVVDAPLMSVWLPCLVCLLAVVELLWGSRRLMVAFVAGHLGATLLVALGLIAGVELAWLPASISRVSDVGMSYGAMGVLGALTAAVPRRWRPVWAGWWIGVGVIVVAMDGDFTDTGHLVALLLGMVVATRFGTTSGWTVARLSLCAFALPFGFLVLASSAPELFAACIGGVLGAMLAQAGAAGRESRPPGDTGVEVTT
jgi:hypothetical protein